MMYETTRDKPCFSHFFNAFNYQVAFLSIVVLAVLFLRDGQAAHPYNGLSLEPSSTVLVIFEKDEVLSRPLNIQRFARAGFTVVVLRLPQKDDEFAWLWYRLSALKQQFQDKSLLFTTTSRHSKTVNHLYQKPSFGSLVKGVILFRAQEIITRDFHITPGSAPPLLVIALERDEVAVIRASRKYSDHLRSYGIWSWFVMLPPDRGIERQTSPVITIILSFIGSDKIDQTISRSLLGHALWQNPDLHHNEFYDQPDFIKDQPISAKFRDEMKNYFHLAASQLRQWPLRHFKTFDILKFQEAKNQDLPRFLIFKNAFGQFLSLDLKLYKAYRPRLVIGIDHERNLFRFHWFFKNKAQYSWIANSNQKDISVNLLGAFLYFEKPLPKDLQIPFSLRSKLTFDSFRFSHQDPLQPLSGLPKAWLQTIRTTNCIHCHSLRGLGGSGHHIVAHTGQAQGGYALPLEFYSKEVLMAFLYNQDRVAKIIGVVPNPVPAEHAANLRALLREEKARLLN